MPRRGSHRFVGDLVDVLGAADEAHRTEAGAVLVQRRFARFDHLRMALDRRHSIGYQRKRDSSDVR